MTPLMRKFKTATYPIGGAEVSSRDGARRKGEMSAGAGETRVQRRRRAPKTTGQERKAVRDVQDPMGTDSPRRDGSVRVRRGARRGRIY